MLGGAAAVWIQLRREQIRSPRLRICYPRPIPGQRGEAAVRGRREGAGAHEGPRPEDEKDAAAAVKRRDRDDGKRSGGGGYTGRRSSDASSSSGSGSNFRPDGAHGGLTVCAGDRWAQAPAEGLGRGGRGRRRQRRGWGQHGGDEAPRGGMRGSADGGIQTEAGACLHGVSAKEVERRGLWRLATGTEGGGAERGKERTGQRRRPEGGRFGAWLHGGSAMVAEWGE